LKIDRFNPYKILKYPLKLDLLARGGLSAPLIWHIYPTNACTNDCNFCIMKDDRSENKSAVLSADIFDYIIGQARECNSKTIHFSGGGEPLLNPETLNMIIKAKKYKLKVALSTNLNVSLDNGGIKTIAENVDYLRVSINAGTEDTYNLIMKPKMGGFNRVLENIDRINNFMTEIPGDLGLAMVLTHENAFEILNFCSLAEKKHADFVHIRPAYWPEKDKEIYETVKNTLQVYSEDDIKKAFSNLDVNIRLDKFAGHWTPDRGYLKCRATPLLACVKATGDLIVCQDRMDLTFGNLNERFFDEIWKSKEHLEAIESIDLEKCPRCVEGPKNQIIESCFVRDDWRGDLF